MMMTLIAAAPLPPHGRNPAPMPQGQTMPMNGHEQHEAMKEEVLL